MGPEEGCSGLQIELRSSGAAGSGGASRRRVPDEMITPHATGHLRHEPSVLLTTPAGRGWGLPPRSHGRRCERPCTRTESGVAGSGEAWTRPSGASLGKAGAVTAPGGPENPARRKQRRVRQLTRSFDRAVSGGGTVGKQGHLALCQGGLCRSQPRHGHSVRGARDVVKSKPVAKPY